jgi:hypothetical protein
MKLTVLGKYGPWPAAGGACSGYLVETEDVRLMLDCGCGTLGRLQQHCRLEALDGIVLSHLHPDHMGDIPALRYALPHYVGTGLMEARLPVFLPDAPHELANPILNDENIDGTAVAGGDSIEYKGVRLAPSAGLVWRTTRLTATWYEVSYTAVVARLLGGTSIGWVDLFGGPFVVRYGIGGINPNAGYLFGAEALARVSVPLSTHVRFVVATRAHAYADRVRVAYPNDIGFATPRFELSLGIGLGWDWSS